MHYYEPVLWDVFGVTLWATDVAGGVLFGGYGLAAVLLLLYFVWEDGPFHNSQRVESMYLYVILFLIYGASLVFAQIAVVEDSQLCQKDVQIRDSHTVRHLMLIFVLFNIVSSFVKARLMTCFYDTLGSEDVKKAQQLHQIEVEHPVVARIVHELEDTMREIVHEDGDHTLKEVLVQALGPILLFLLVIMNIMQASQRVRPGEWAYEPYVSHVAEPLVVLATVYFSVVRWLRLGPRLERLEAQVHRLVAEDRFVHLQYVLATVSVGTLVSVSRRVKWLLTEEALDKGLLSTHSKAIIIDALQRVGLKSKRNQTAVKRIFETTYRSQLTVLKNLLDGRGDYHNLFKLVYQDISHPGIQNDIIKHLIDEAQLAREQLGQAAGIKVLSDIDDTLYSSGGRFPAGCDKQFPKGVVYPGCLTLFNALDKGFTIGVPSCNLVFVSARPHVYKSWAEEKSYKLFRSLMEQQRIHTFPTLLPGNLKSSLLATIWACFRRTTAWRDVGERKYDIYQHYVRLYLEYEFVFCGDDGQGDLFAGQRMLSNGARRTCLDEHAACSDEDSAEGDSSEEEHGRCVEEVSVEDSIGTTLATSHSGEVKEGSPLAVLIHEVSQHGQLTRLLSQPLEETQPRLIFHRTYVGAAVDLNAIRPDLVTAKDVQEVANDAVQEFERTRIVYPDMLQSLQEAEVDLLADLDRARTVIQAAGLDEVRRLRSRSVMDTRFREENWELIQTRTMPTAVGPTDSLTVRVPTRHQSH
mmetsp:Transcript_98103/g.316365  ORF Transcript_98103/g.316365 Transcript_98103/m.316365 type:complete len:749 (+) Transcript_98103:29-2275(+)